MLLPSSASRIFGLDALRAFAILTTVHGHSYHLLEPVLHPISSALIFDGVSVFFVLSGFLIGGILLRTLEKKAASFPVLLDFWLKRWIRTVPPYLLALFLVLAVTWYQSDSFKLTYFKAYFVFLQNFNWPIPEFFIESWSLSVEEWFYLLIPSSIFLLIFARLSPQAATLVTTFVVMLGVTYYRFYKHQHSPPLTPETFGRELNMIVLLRLDALMYGVLGAYIAAYHPTIWQRNIKLTFLVGLGLLISIKFIPAPVSGMYAAVFSFSHMALAVLLMLPFLNEWKQVSGVAARVVTHVSLISYSLYLLHSTLLLWTFIMPNLHQLPGTPSEQKGVAWVLFWGLSLVLSTFMYKYFEVPIMSLRSRLR